MKINAQSIRPFIGARDFAVSSNFYREIGFTETVLFHNLSLFKTGEFGFYLQNAFVKDWIDNSMVFMEVDDVERFWNELQNLDLPAKFKGVKLKPICEFSWGKECYLHDPSGILWHFGEFFQKNKL